MEKKDDILTQPEWIVLCLSAFSYQWLFLAEEGVAFKRQEAT